MATLNEAINSSDNKISYDFLVAVPFTMLKWIIFDLRNHFESKFDITYRVFLFQIPKIRITNIFVVSAAI